MRDDGTDRLYESYADDNSPTRKAITQTFPPAFIYSSDGMNTSLSTADLKVEEESDSNYADLEDVLLDHDPDLSRFGRAGTKHATVNWFKETQLSNVKVPNQNRFAEWFHGIISRKEAERLLKDKVLGCFLIRVSESRFGYSLSFKAEARCRHYMIDQLSCGKFNIIGEPKIHGSLHDLIDYHKKVKISNWDHFLSVPCGQDKDQSDYADLVRGDYFELEAAQPQAQKKLQQVTDYIPCGYSLQRSTKHPYHLNSSSSSNVKTILSLGPNATKRPLPKLPEEDSHTVIGDRQEERRLSESFIGQGVKEYKHTLETRRRRASVV